MKISVDVVVDRLIVENDISKRLSQSLESALALSKWNLECIDNEIT